MTMVSEINSILRTTIYELYIFKISFGSKHILLTFLIGLLSVISAIPGKSQDRVQTSAALQEQLLGGLASDELERRIDSLVKMGQLLTSYPSTVTDSTFKALANSLVRDQSPVVRALAAHAMELGGDSRAADSLIGALKKEQQVGVLKAIAYALARYPSAEVSNALFSLLKDKHQEVRAAASHAIAESGDSSALAPLLEVLKKLKNDRDVFTRSEAARGLGKIGNRAAIPTLLKALTDDESFDVRREAALALGKIATRQDNEVINALRQATLSSDPYLTMAADSALTCINARLD